MIYLNWDCSGLHRGPCKNNSEQREQINFGLCSKNFHNKVFFKKRLEVEKAGIFSVVARGNATRFLKLSYGLSCLKKIPTTLK